MHKVAIVIINWNAPKDTIHCLEQLQGWHTLAPVVWIVDNGSADDSVRLIREFINAMSPSITRHSIIGLPITGHPITGHPITVKLIENGENQGFGGGSNRGIEAALADDADTIFLLNNDADLSEADAIALVDALDHDPTIGIITPLIYDTQTPPQLYSAGNRNAIFSHEVRKKIIESNALLSDVANVSGTAVAIRSQLFIELGLLDKQYFFGMEFSDFCHRVIQHGARCVVHNKAKVYHHIERSSDARQTLHMYYAIRNRFIFIRNFYHLWKPFLFGFWTIYSLLLGVKLWLTGGRASARAIYLGLVDGLQARFGKQNERIMNHLQ